MNGNDKSGTISDVLCRVSARMLCILEGKFRHQVGSSYMRSSNIL